MSNIFIGIDYSLASPAITVISSGTPKFFFLTSKRKFVGNITPYLIGSAYPDMYKSDVERYKELSNWAIQIIKTECSRIIPHICLEGYSFSSTGSRLAQIHEATGVLKYVLDSQGYCFDSVPPTAIKKFFTGKGNADKKLMCQTFIEQTGFLLHEELGSKVIDSKPAQDIVDSYAIASYASSRYIEDTKTS